MSSLPTGWITAPLGAFTLDCGQRVPEEFEEFKYIDIGSVNRDTKRIETPQRLLGKNAPSRARKYVKAGDVLVSMTRPNLNAVALVPDELDGQIASTGFDVLRASFGIEHRWVSYLVRTDAFVEAMSELVQGALYPAVRPRDIRGFEAPLAPLNEQKRIADKLDAVLARVDACRDRLDRIPAILKRFRQSVLAAATSGKLTEDWRGISECVGWNKLPLADLCLSITDGDHQAPPQAETGIPFITISAINDGQLRLEKASRFVPKSYFDALKESRRPQRGDILFSVTGSIAIPAMVDTDRPFTFQRHIAILRPDPSKISSGYLKFVLGAKGVQQQALSVATGTAQLTIPLNGLRSFEIELPPPVEQHEIVRRVEALFACADRLEARYTAARAQVEKLTPATLAKAFRGELVSQDPNDEPASVLLERIHAARASVAGTGSQKQRKVSEKAVRKFNAEVIMLELSRIKSDHLNAILKDKGRLDSKALWQASQLSIEDFYEQLRTEEAKRLLREVREGNDSFLEAA